MTAWISGAVTTSIYLTFLGDTPSLLRLRTSKYYITIQVREVEGLCGGVLWEGFVERLWRGSEGVWLIYNISSSFCGECVDGRGGTSTWEEELE